MNSLEKNLWAMLKNNVEKLRAGRVHLQRIETGSTGRGIPDVNYCSHLGEGWVELKVVQGRRVELRPEQVAWHVRRATCGGHSFILARHKAEGPRLGKIDDIYLFDSVDAVKVADLGIDAPAIWKWSAPFDWDQILNRMGM